MNMLLVAAVTGFLAGEFAGALIAENIAHEFEELYAAGFYIVPAAPEISLANAATESEEAYLARLCRLPAEQDIAALN
ncbi:hypothetical protein [Thalassobaculum sp.]|uniref:hypothetical protein n=1 Tax=Thalassobaculum sp. TaxID=2022740 RepID=UPI0032F08A11